MRVVLFSLISVALMTLDHRQKLVSPVRYTLSAVVYPIQYLVNLPFSIGNFLSEDLASRSRLLEENTRLRAQQLLDEARLQKMDSLETENIRLRNLLDSSFDIGDSVLIAELMRVDLDPYTHLIKIDKGTTNSVFVGQPVIDATGVMGQVDSVGPMSSTVRLITDPSSAIPVQVNRNGLRTIAMGTGDINKLQISYLPNNADIRKGDLLVTSGLGGRFPEGYPVARVTTVRHDRGEPFAVVWATPTAKLNRSREVLLIRTKRPARGIDGTFTSKEQTKASAAPAKP